jgi:hypothetical protein
MVINAIAFLFSPQPTARFSIRQPRKKSSKVSNASISAQNQFSASSKRCWKTRTSASAACAKDTILQEHGATADDLEEAKAAA